METKHLTRFAAAFVVCATMALFWVRQLRPDSVQRHLSRLNDIKSGKLKPGPFRARHFLAASTWSWYVRGQPKTDRWKVEALDWEWNALVRLKYAEIREFPLEQRRFDQRFWMELCAAARDAPDGFLTDRNFRAFGMNRSPNIVRMALCRSDVEAFGQIVSRLDARR